MIEQLQGMADGGATIISTRLWLVDMAGTTNEAYRLDSVPIKVIIELPMKNILFFQVALPTKHTGASQSEAVHPGRGTNCIIKRCPPAT